MNAFMLGMQSVNPKGRLKFILVDAWYDPAKEGAAAKALIEQGCDVITQHTDLPTPLQVAAEPRRPGVRRRRRHGQARPKSALDVPTSTSRAPITSSASRR